MKTPRKKRQTTAHPPARPERPGQPVIDSLWGSAEKSELLRELETQNADLRRTQATLEESRNTFDDLYNFSPIGYAMLDPRGTILSLNASLCELLKCTGQLILHSPFSRFIGKDDQAAFSGHLANVFSGSGRECCELQLELPDGSSASIHVESVRQPHATGENAPSCLTAIIDTTHLKEAEDGLRMSRQYLRTVIENIPDCVKLIGEDGKILEINSAGCRMLEAHTPAEILGKSIFGFLAPEHHAVYREMHRRICTGETERLEFEIIDLNGSRRWMETSAMPLRDSRNGKTLHLGVARDITERKQAVDALRESGSQLQNLIYLLPAAICTTDLDGRITFFNEQAAELWGRRPELGVDLWCGSWRMLNPDGTLLPHDQSPIALSLREGCSVRNREIILQRPDGTVAYVLPHTDPLRDSTGRITGAVNMLVDITERRRMETELQNAYAELESRVNERTKQLLEINQALELKIVEITRTRDELREKEYQLQMKNDYLERFQQLTVGREIRMVELKREVNELLQKLGLPVKYKQIE